MNVAKDLWEMFGAKPPVAPAQPTDADTKEMLAEIQWKRNMRELEAQQAAKEEAERHDW